MIGMGAALGLLKGVSGKMWLMIGAALVALFLVFKIMAFINAKDEALEQAKVSIENLNSALVRTQAERREAEIERDTTLAELSRQEATQEASRRLMESLAVEMAATRKEVESVKDLFDKHDFTNLANKKSGLILTRVNRGTENVFKDIQNAVNSD